MTNFISSRKYFQSAGLLVFSFCVFCNNASAELYKCKDAKGKVLYSESPCPSKYSGGGITLEDNPIESAGIKRLEAQRISRSRSSDSSSATNSSTTIVTTTSENLMSDYDRNNRINEILIDSKSMVASPEKKADALNEQRALTQGAVYLLSHEDELIRKNLKRDLNSDDRNKRYNALTRLQGIYYKYSKPND